MKHVVQTRLVVHPIPPFQIDLDMRKMHHGAVREVALRRLVGIARNRLEARQRPIGQPMNVARGESHKQHRSSRNLFRARNPQPLGHLAGHAAPGKTAPNRSHVEQVAHVDILPGNAVQQMRARLKQRTNHIVDVLVVVALEVKRNIVLLKHQIRRIFGIPDGIDQRPGSRLAVLDSPRHQLLGHRRRNDIP